MAWATAADLERYWGAAQASKWDASVFDNALKEAEREARSALSKRYLVGGEWAIPAVDPPRLLVDLVCAVAAAAIVRLSMYAQAPPQVEAAIKVGRTQLDRLGRGFGSLGLEGAPPVERTRSRALAMRGRDEATFTREKLEGW